MRVDFVIFGDNNNQPLSSLATVAGSGITNNLLDGDKRRGCCAGDSK